MRVLMAILLVLGARSVAAEPLIVDLWPGKPADDAGITGWLHQKEFLPNAARK